MIDTNGSQRIHAYAYVPEHLVAYVTSVSGAEPYLFGDYICYEKDGLLIFVGYPLGVPFGRAQMESRLAEATKTLKPKAISLVAPELNVKGSSVIRKESDVYYRLEVDGYDVSPKIRTMIRRASRHIFLHHDERWSKNHDSLVTEFLTTHHISDETRDIFLSIPRYLDCCPSARLVTALDREGHVIGCDIVDFGSKDYAFYMFNFVSRARYVPGTADALLHEVVTLTRHEGKRFINLGLGIHDGIAFFKKKWGGSPFLTYEFVLYRTSQGILDLLLGRL